MKLIQLLKTYEKNVYRIFTWKLSTTNIRCCIISQQYTQYNDTTACVNWPMKNMCIGHLHENYNNKHTLLYNLPTIHSIQRYNGLCELNNSLLQKNYWIYNIYSLNIIAIIVFNNVHCIITLLRKQCKLFILWHLYVVHHVYTFKK